jgi:hypothetical protein
MIGGEKEAREFIALVVTHLRRLAQRLGAFGDGTFGFQRNSRPRPKKAKKGRLHFSGRSTMLTLVNGLYTLLIQVDSFGGTKTKKECKSPIRTQNSLAAGTKAARRRNGLIL